MWIALKFFVLLQSKQLRANSLMGYRCCELLSNFLYFCSRNNTGTLSIREASLWIALKFFVLLQSKQPSINDARAFFVVNCSQIFCTFAVETTQERGSHARNKLWIALKFFVLLQSKQRVVSAVEVTSRCELLSNFLYFCSRNNVRIFACLASSVVNCSQIFCTFAVETTHGEHTSIEAGCELLSNFLYFCSRNN